jgi:hypothetical protein
MSSSLKLDWCSHAAAKYAVEHWHYSRSMPAGKSVKVGVWESGQFIGAVVFSRGAAREIGSPYGLAQTEVCELVRVALTTHIAPVSRIVAFAIRLLRHQSEGLRLLVSYADPEQGHYGGIYQAMGWVYVGVTKPHKNYLVRGQWVHNRTGNSIVGSVAGLPSRTVAGKHKYLYPLDAAMRAQIEPLRKPYPKRATSIASDATPTWAGGCADCGVGAW